MSQTRDTRLPPPPFIRPGLAGFTLIELSIVVLVLGLLTAAVIRYATVANESNAIAATNATLDVVETALQNYRNEYGRLPCPTWVVYPESSSNYGYEKYITYAGDGTCNNSTGNATLINSGTDPDGPGGSDPGAPDPLYDSATLNNVVQGGIPTKTLKIPDKYAYDGWGDKIFYAVDIRATVLGAFTTYPVGNTTIGAIVIKKTATDTLANAMTYKGIYALVSMGKTGHGTYFRNTSSTLGIINAGQNNSDLLNNCHCTNTVAATTYTRIYVQKPRTYDLTSDSDNFDSIVRFKTRGDIANSTEMQ